VVPGGKGWRSPPLFDDRLTDPASHVDGVLLSGVGNALVVPGVDQRVVDALGFRQPVLHIGVKLGRSEGAVRSQAGKLGVSLRPTNQSPYNRRAK
jgi:hypothetical protein